MARRRQHHINLILFASFNYSTSIMDNDSSDMSIEAQFRQQLGKLCVDGKKTVLMKKDEYFQLIEEVKVADTAEIKTGRQYYILKRLVIAFNA